MTNQLTLVSLEVYDARITSLSLRKRYNKLMLRHDINVLESLSSIHSDSSAEKQSKYNIWLSRLFTLSFGLGENVSAHCNICASEIVSIFISYDYVADDIVSIIGCWW